MLAGAPDCFDALHLMGVLEHQRGRAADALPWFDRALAGKAVFTDEEKRGFELFMTENEPRTGQLGADCFHCHGGPLFSDHQFHNNGLEGDEPGREAVTGLPGDRGKFSTPPE